MKAPQDRTWDFLSDLRRLGSCVPGVESVEISQNGRAHWNVNMKVGRLPKRLAIVTEVVEQEAPRHARFRGRGENIEMEGTVSLQPLGPRETMVHYTMKVQAKGPMARILDNFLKGRLPSQVREFAKNVRRNLED